MIEQRKAEIFDKVAKVIMLGEQKFGVKLPPVDVRFDLRGVAAGMAGISNNQLYVRFNIDYIQQGGETYDHLLNDTVSHEIAHSFCQAYPILGRNHDDNRKRICLQLGGTGKRTHDQEIIYAKGRTYTYITTIGKTVNVSERRHRLIQQGKVYTVRDGGHITKCCQYSLHAATQVKQPVRVAAEAANI